MDSPELQSAVLTAATEIIFQEGCHIVGNPIPIHDAQGPILFLDYVIASNTSGKLAWVRGMPDAIGSPAGPIVTIQAGQHPFRSQTRQINLKKRLVNKGFKSPNLRRFSALLSGIKVNSDKLEKRRSEFIASLSDQPADDSAPTLVCYHYPEVGILVERPDNKIGYVDIEDGRFFELTEAGNENGSLETRVPYSFLDKITEAGDPGNFTVPSEEFTVPGISLIPQLRDNWCAAASCQMILQSHGLHVEQSKIAELMAIPEDPANGGASKTGQLNAFSQASNGKTTPFWDSTPTGQECIDELAKGRALKNGIYQHAQVVAGWKTSSQGPLYLIYDPLPVGKGSIKYQNPRVIWSMNFVTVLPKDS